MLIFLILLHGVDQLGLKKLKTRNFLLCAVSDFTIEEEALGEVQVVINVD